MKLTKAKKINVLILEDDLYYNSLLAQKIQILQQKTHIQNIVNIHIKQFNIPLDFLHAVKSTVSENTSTIAFIDYFLGYGITGLDIVYLLQEINKNIKIILMSQSEKTIKNLNEPFWTNKNFVKIIKHNYTPDICCTIVENHIKNI